MLVVMGGLFATGGLILSAHLEDITLFTVMYGALLGVSLGLIYLPSMLAVNMYFEAKRAVAVGLATTGSCAGFFVFAPSIEFIIRNYGLKATFLVMSSLTALVSLLGLALKPPPAVKAVHEEDAANPIHARCTPI